MAAGVIPPEEKPLRHAQMLTLERTGGPLDSFVHAPPTGGYGIVIWVRVVVVKSGVALSGCRLTPRRWDDDDINLMDPTEGVSYYKAIGGVEYPRNDVLNRWISSNRYLKNGKVLEGVVIAQSPRSLPAWCVDGISIEAELCFVDQFDNVYPLNVDLRIMRGHRAYRPPKPLHWIVRAGGQRKHARYLWRET